MNLLLYIVGYVFVILGIIGIGVAVRKDAEKYFSTPTPNSTYSIIIRGERKTFTFQTIDELLENREQDSDKPLATPPKLEVEIDDKSPAIGSKGIVTDEDRVLLPLN